MFDFLKNNKSRQTTKNIRLVSIHIPKTAGTSFRHTLVKEYGADKVCRLDIDPNKVHSEQRYFLENILTNDIQVLHGHMPYDCLIKNFNISQNIPVITWLRNPVDRVISNYMYLSKRLEEELDEKGKNLNILSKMKRSLLEYATNEVNRNRMSKFLHGLELEKLTFIGFIENYSEDLKQLAQLMNWQNIEEHNINITGKKIDHISDSDKDIIREMNELDINLYRKALALRSISEYTRK